MLTRNKIKLLNEAAEIEAKEARTAGMIGYMARMLVQANMPYSDPGDVAAWGRRSGAFSLIMQPGMTMDDNSQPKSIGMPYGSLPRLLLAWISTEAVRTREPVVILGDTLSAFMRELGLVPTGGRWGSITRLRNQMMRLFSASISCTYDGPGQWANSGIRIADEAHLWWDQKQPHQAMLWQSTVTLGSKFFEELISHPVPLDMRALKALRRSPMALYDPVYNQEQVVVGLPVAVVLTAQISNLIEQFAVTTLDLTASGTSTGCGTLPPMQYQTTGGSVAPALLAATANSTVQNATQAQYLANYMSVCWTFELGRPGTGTTLDMLMSPGCGVTMLDVLALAKNPAIFVTNPQNLQVSCTEAFTDIETFYTNPANAGAAALNACGGSDFSDMAQCQSLIASITNSTLGLTIDPNSFILQQTLANLSTLALASGDASSVQLIAQAQQSNTTSGVLASVNNPQLINTYLACVIIMIPFIAMLLVTGSMWRKALSLILSFLFFITILRVLDVICFHLWASHYQSAMAAAYNNDGLGSAVSLTLNTKISGMLNILGYMRSSISVIATVVSGALFHFSDQGMARMGARLEAKSEKIDNDFKDPGNASLQDQKQAGAREAMIASIASGAHGMQNYAIAEEGRIMSDAAGTRGAMAAAGSPGAYAASTGEISGQKFSHDAAKAGQLTNSTTAESGVQEGRSTQGAVDLRHAAIETLQQHDVSQEGVDKVLASYPDAGGLAATVEQADRQSPDLEGGAFGQKIQEGRIQAAAGNLQEQVQDPNMTWNRTQAVGPDGSQNDVYQAGDTRLVASTNDAGEMEVNGISGGSSSLTSNAGWRDTYQQARREVDQETASSSQDLSNSVGRGLRNAETSGQTWDQLSAYANNSGSSTTFRQEWGKTANDILSNATTITDSHGKDRTSELHAGASLGLPKIVSSMTGITADAGGSYRITTKDGNTYTANLDKKHSDAIHNSVAKTTSDEYRRSHEDRSSTGNHTGLQRVVEASQSTQAADHLSKAISHSQSLEKSRSATEDLGAGSDVKLNVPFYNHIADSIYGNHSVDNVRGAVGYVEKMTRDGNSDQVAQLQKEFLTTGKYLPSNDTGSLPAVNGPNQALDPTKVGQQIDSGKKALETNLEARPTPQGANVNTVNNDAHKRATTGMPDPTAPGGAIPKANSKLAHAEQNIQSAYAVSKASVNDLGGLLGTEGAPMPTVEQVSSGHVPQNSPTHITQDLVHELFPVTDVQRQSADMTSGSEIGWMVNGGYEKPAGVQPGASPAAPQTPAPAQPAGLVTAAQPVEPQQVQPSGSAPASSSPVEAAPVNNPPAAQVTATPEPAAQSVTPQLHQEPVVQADAVAQHPVSTAGQVSTATPAAASRTPEPPPAAVTPAIVTEQAALQAPATAQPAGLVTAAQPVEPQQVQPSGSAPASSGPASIRPGGDSGSSPARPGGVGETPRPGNQ
jgi:hypothetical protein